MPQIRTLLNQEEGCEFGALLLWRIEQLIGEATTVKERQSVRRRIMNAINQPSISRISDYAQGKYFPTPRVVRALAVALGGSSFWFLRAAGYEREVVRDIHDFWLRGRRASTTEDLYDLVCYAVKVFPRRGEQYINKRSPYLEAFIEPRFPPLDEKKDRYALRPPLEQAYSVLT